MGNQQKIGYISLTYLLLNNSIINANKWQYKISYKLIDDFIQLLEIRKCDSRQPSSEAFNIALPI